MLERLIDILFPRYCPVCNKRLSHDERPICLMCNMDLPRLNVFSNPTDNSIAESFWGKANVDRVAAFMKYMPQGGTAAIIHDVKYNQRAKVGYDMGRMMAQEAIPHGFFDGIDAILPTPISAGRRITRGYNQSEMISHGVSSITKLPVLDLAVLRISFDQSQTKLTREERQHNVKDVFRVINPEALADKHILVIDDVVTTGATLQSLINEIHNHAPNTRVSILALCKAGEHVTSTNTVQDYQTS